MTHPLIADAATLAFLAGQACVTPHVWLSRSDRPRRPDRLVIDLDPPGPEAFPVILDTARDARSVLVDLGLRPYVMTTGSSGLHVVAPLQRRADVEDVRDLARDVAALLAARDPDRLTTSARIKDRGGRVYVDAGRNAYGQHGVAPYAVPALEGAPVATPLAWDELDAPGLGPRSHALRSVPARLAERGDPWAGIAGDARPPGAARRALDRMRRRS